MRNLTIIANETLGLPSSSASSASAKQWLPASHEQCKIEAISINPTSNDVYVAAVERRDESNVASTSRSQELAKIWVWHQLPAQCHSSQVQGSDTTPAFAPIKIELPSNPCPFVSGQGKRIPPRSSQLYHSSKNAEADEARRPADLEVVLLQFLNEGGSICDNSPALSLVTAGGDIVIGRIPSREEALYGKDADDDLTAPPLHFEVVGSIEQGIYAAQWSPDEEFLVVVTAPTWLEDGKRGEGEKLLIMTKEFEVLSERALSTDEFGEGEHSRCFFYIFNVNLAHTLLLQTNLSTSGGAQRQLNFTVQKARLPQKRLLHCLHNRKHLAAKGRTLVDHT